MGDVRVATEQDLPAMRESLARAFSDDPVQQVLFPDGTRRRQERLASFMGLGIEGGLRHDTVWTTPGHEATAVWRPPGRWRVKPGEMLPATPRLLRALGARVLAGMRILQTIEQHHASEPHWYLEVLGTDPPAQGRGLGAAVIRPVLERCDAEGIGAYLESSKESNVAWYRRFGWEVTEVLRLPAGPDVWLMWRDPQPA